MPPAAQQPPSAADWANIAQPWAAACPGASAGPAIKATTISGARRGRSLIVCASGSMVRARSIPGGTGSSAGSSETAVRFVRVRSTKTTDFATAIIAGILMRKLRVFIAALLAFWLVLGPAGGAWASGGGASCESMMGTLPADDCCGENETAATSCAGVCAAASLGIAFASQELQRVGDASAAVPSPCDRHVSRTTAPDLGPPRPSISNLTVA